MLEYSNARGKSDSRLLILCMSLLELTYNSAPPGSPAFPNILRQGIGISGINFTYKNYVFKLVLEELRLFSKRLISLEKSYFNCYYTHSSTPEQLMNFPFLESL